LKSLKDFLRHNKSGQGKKLALTGLIVTNTLDSGIACGSSTRDRLEKALYQPALNHLVGINKKSFISNQAKSNVSSEERLTPLARVGIQQACPGFQHPAAPAPVLSPPHICGWPFRCAWVGRAPCQHVPIAKFAFQRKWNHSKDLKDIDLQVKGQTLGLTVLCVSCSMDSGKGDSS
jgi:hypothetical protein